MYRYIKAIEVNYPECIWLKCQENQLVSYAVSSVEIELKQ